MASKELSDALYCAVRGNPTVDVLIDPLANEEWRQLDGAASLEDDQIHALRDKVFQERPDQAPTLLRLPLERYEAIESWLGLAEHEARDTSLKARLMGGFLVNELPLAALATQVARGLTAQVPGHAIYFRYFDPRVLHHLPRLLKPGQWAALLPPGVRWHYVDWSGQLITHEPVEAAQRKALFLRFSAQQWKAIESIEHFNAALSVLRRRGVDSTPSQTESLFERVMAARHSGLNEPGDVAHYVLVSTLLGNELNTKLPWGDVLSALLRGAKLSELIPV